MLLLVNTNIYTAVTNCCLVVVCVKTIIGWLAEKYSVKKSKSRLQAKLQHLFAAAPGISI